MATIAEDLTTREGIIALMKSSKSMEEWNANCDKVIQANNGYPDFWFEIIVMSGLVERVRATWR